MTKQDYAAERLDPRWQKKRLEIMERDKFACCRCGDGKDTLAVHHSYYVKGRKCWEYPAFSLRTLCKGCHHDIHHPPPLDADEEASQYSEWERVADWLSGGQPDGLEELWDIAGNLCQLEGGGKYSRKEVLTRMLWATEEFKK